MSKDVILDSVDVGGPNNDGLEDAPMDDDGEATYLDGHVPQRAKDPNNAGGFCAGNHQEDTVDRADEDADEASPNVPTPKEIRQRTFAVSIKVHRNHNDDPSEADTDVESSGAVEAPSDPFPLQAPANEVPNKKLAVISKVQLNEYNEWRVDCEASTCTPAKSAAPPALAVKRTSRSFLESQEDVWQIDTNYMHSRPGPASRTGTSHDVPNDAGLGSSKSTDTCSLLPPTKDGRKRNKCGLIKNTQSKREHLLNALTEDDEDSSHPDDIHPVQCMSEDTSSDNDFVPPRVRNELVYR
jgi:hypothetical protein